VKRFAKPENALNAQTFDDGVIKISIINSDFHPLMQGYSADFGLFVFVHILGCVRGNLAAAWGALKRNLLYRVSNIS